MYKVGDIVRLIEELNWSVYTAEWLKNGIFKVVEIHSIFGPRISPINKKYKNITWYVADYQIELLVSAD